MAQLSRILKQISQVPTDSLRSKILARIELEREERDAWKARFALIGIVFSGSLLLIALLSAGASLLQSEFWTILSLLFSDMSIITASFQDFVYSLIETLPILPIISLLLPLFLLTISLSFWSTHSRKENTKTFRSARYAH